MLNSRVALFISRVANFNSRVAIFKKRASPAEMFPRYSYSPLHDVDEEETNMDQGANEALGGKCPRKNDIAHWTQLYAPYRVGEKKLEHLWVRRYVK